MANIKPLYHSNTYFDYETVPYPPENNTPLKTSLLFDYQVLVQVILPRLKTLLLAGHMHEAQNCDYYILYLCKLTFCHSQCCVIMLQPLEAWAYRRARTRGINCIIENKPPPQFGPRLGLNWWGEGGGAYFREDMVLLWY